MRFSTISLSALALVSAMPAMAQEASEPTAPAPSVTVTGSFGVTSDYRFRGLSQSHEHLAGQGTINVNHESGLYVGTWASTIDDDHSLPGYGNYEVDLYGGYTKTLDNGLGFDVGMLYYFYADARSYIAGVKNDTDFFEPYASVNYSIGPANVKVGANYGWSQAGLGDQDTLYLYSNLAVTVPNTPVKLLGHIGRSDGALGAFNLDPADESYLDWSLGAEVGYRGFTLGISYVDTDITQQRILGERFNNAVGGDSTVLGYLTYAF